VDIGWVTYARQSELLVCGSVDPDPIVYPEAGKRKMRGRSIGGEKTIKNRRIHKKRQDWQATPILSNTG
jgi:hypothetical protein